MLNWFRNRKSLNDALNETKLVVVHGVRFRIKRIDPNAYLEGAKAMLKLADTYKTKTQKEAEASASDEKKIRQHYEDVFMASVVEPKLCRKLEDGELLVSNMFTDPDLVNQLYAEIMAFTYRKKKSQLLGTTPERG